MKEDLEQARWWSWRRQRLDRSCRNIEDCLRSVVAIPATHPWGPLALLARVPRLTPGHAADATTAQIGFRTRALHNIPYLVPFAAAPIALSVGDLVPAARRARTPRNVTKPTYRSIANAITAATEEAPLARNEVGGAIRRSRANLDAVLDAMIAEGRLTEVAPGSALIDAWSVVDTTAWLGDERELLEPPDALARFADGYLTAFGPATIDDFVEFTGVGARDARAAFATLKTVDLGGGLLLHERDARGFGGLRPFRNRVTLLPRGDAWLMAYGETLERFGPPRMIQAAFDGRGIALPTVLIDAEIAGTWNLTIRRSKATITVELLRRIEAAPTALLQEELRLIADFLDAAGLTPTIAPLPKPKRR